MKKIITALANPMLNNELKKQKDFIWNSTLLRSRVEFFTRRRGGIPSASCI